LLSACGADVNDSGVENHTVGNPEVKKTKKNRYVENPYLKKARA